MKTKFSIALLCLLSVTAPLAHLAELPGVKALAAATHAAPAMKVFTSHEGYETFSPRFHIDWVDQHGPQTLELTPAVYRRVLGPYNRRNAYGAALSYAPVLSRSEHTRDMHASVMRFAMCGKAPMLQELGIDANSLVSEPTVRIEPRRALGGDWNLAFEVNCRG
jgi:hypothetical protein